MAPSRDKHERSSVDTGSSDASIHKHDELLDTPLHGAKPAVTQPTSEKDPEKDSVAPAIPQPVFNPADFPDGGLQAWLCVFGGFCCLFVLLQSLDFWMINNTTQVRLVRLDQLHRRFPELLRE